MKAAYEHYYQRLSTNAGGHYMYDGLAAATSDLPVLDGFAESDRRAILDLAMIERIEANTQLFREGCVVGRLIYHVLSGEVVLSRNDADRGEVIVDRLSRGAYFGEGSLFGWRDRSVTATVTQRARLLVLTKSAFDQLLTTQPAAATAFALAVAGSLTERLHRVAARAGATDQQL